MSRRNRYTPKSNNFLPVVSKLERFADSPLQEIAAQLKNDLLLTQQIFQLGEIAEENVLSLIDSVGQIIQVFPLTFGDRFLFDFYILEGIIERWSQKQKLLTNIVIPRYDEEWAHITQIMPTSDRKGVYQSLNFVCFPGSENIGDIDLIMYPFLCHELGHNLFFYMDLPFDNMFEQELRKIVNTFKLRAISDQGLAKTRAENTWRRILELWLPKPNQQDWAHEIAMDLVALWTCGPSYLEAFYHSVEGKNPYLLTTIHPPYAFRTQALLKASEELGWQNYTDKLNRLLKSWERSRWIKFLNNEYFAITNMNLLDACIKVSFATFYEIGLPRCGKRIVNRVIEKLRRKQSLNWGLETLLGAWLFYIKYGNEKYSQWERKLILEKIDSFTP